MKQMKLSSLVPPSLKVAFLLSIMCCTPAFSQEGSWLDEGNYDISWYDGTQNTYYISSAKELAGLSYLSNKEKYSFEGKTIILKKDIDLSSHYWESIDCFSGTLDGNGKKIDYIYPSVKDDFWENISFVEKLSNGNIKNLTIGGNSLFTYQGEKTRNISFCSYMHNNSKIDNCTNYANFQANTCYIMATFCATTDGTSILSNCINYGTLYAENNEFCCGIVGCFNQENNNPTGTIYNCKNYGTISSYSKSSGIVGYCNGNVNQCQNFGKITYTPNYSSTFCASGIAYTIDGDILNCKNSGSILGYESAAGITYKISGTTPQRHARNIIECENTGNITSSNTACGIAIEAEGDINISNCINTGNISSVQASSGLAGGIIAFTICPGTQYSTYINSCINHGEVYANSSLGLAGGIVAQGDEHTIIDKCINYGTIKSIGNKKLLFFPGDYVKTEAAGIGNATTNGLSILNCYNEGTIIAQAEAYSSQFNPNAKAYASGIGGRASNVYNSYNVGTVSSNTSVNADAEKLITETANWSGGITATNNALIYNCYNRGEINYSYMHNNPTGKQNEKWEVHAGGLTGTTIDDEHIRHSFYSNDTYSFYSRWNNPSAESTEDIDTYIYGGKAEFIENDKAKTTAFVEELNKRQTFVEINNNNYELQSWECSQDGYPILTGLDYTSTKISTPESETTSCDFRIDGNNICFDSKNTQKKSIYIYNMQGQILEKFITNDIQAKISQRNQLVIIKVICGDHISTTKIFIR